MTKLLQNKLYLFPTADPLALQKDSQASKVPLSENYSARAI